MTKSEGVPAPKTASPANQAARPTKPPPPPPVKPPASPPGTTPTHTLTETGGLTLKIYKYDKRQGQEKESFHTTVPKDLENLKLDFIRLYLLKHGGLSKQYANSSFCTKNGGEVDEKMLFKDYVGLNGEKLEGTNSIYIRDILRNNLKRAKVDDNLKSFLGSKLNMDLGSNPALTEAPRASAATSGYSHSNWQANSNSDKIVHPADMTEKHWGIVMRNNNILCGQIPQRKGKPSDATGNQEIVGYKRSYYPAFALKERDIPAYNITFDVDAATQEAAGKLGLKDYKPKFRVPRFHITDKTSIEVLETQGEHETSMAESSFDQTSIDTSVGGSYGGFSAGVKLGASWGSKTASATSRLTGKKYMHINYNFPRVELDLSDGQLELNEECKQDIEKLRCERTKERLDDFLSKYGEVFAPHIHLGGRLFSTEESSNVTGSTLSEKSKSWKAAASASFSGWGAQAEINVSHEEGEASKKTTKTSNYKHSISWSADGGDTTLCNNPPAWCPTVASFYNWRVMKQSKLVGLLDFIGGMPGYSDIPFIAEGIRSVYSDPADCVRFGLEARLGRDLYDIVGVCGNTPEARPASLMAKKQAGPANQSRWEDAHDKAAFDGSLMNSMRPAVVTDYDGCLQTSFGSMEPNSDIITNTVKDEYDGEVCDEFAISITDLNNIGTITTGRGEMAEEHIQLKYGVNYPIVLRSNKITYGLDWSTTVKGHSLRGLPGQGSNVLVRFKPQGKEKPFIADGDFVEMIFAWPESKEGRLTYGWAAGQENNLANIFPSSHHQSPAIMFRYRADSTGLLKHVAELTEVKTALEKATATADALKQAELATAIEEEERMRKKAEAEKAHAKSLADLRNKYFPNWKSEKDVKMLVAKGLNNLDKQTELQETENKMNVFLELLLAFTTKKISREVFEDTVVASELPFQWVIDFLGQWPEAIWTVTYS